MKNYTCRIKDAWRVLTCFSYILLYPSKEGLDMSATVNNPLFDALSDRLVTFLRNWYAQTFGKQARLKQEAESVKPKKEGTNEAD